MNGLIYGHLLVVKVAFRLFLLRRCIMFLISTYGITNEFVGIQRGIENLSFNVFVATFLKPP